MPGRPRTMSKRFAELELRSIELAAEVFALAPKQYLDNPDRDDPLNAGWNAVVAATMRTSVLLEQFGDQLRQRAGIDDPGPWAEFIGAPEAEVAADKPRTAPATAPPASVK